VQTPTGTQGIVTVVSRACTQSLQEELEWYLYEATNASLKLISISSLTYHPTIWRYIPGTDNAAKWPSKVYTSIYDI
jgi:hypothetical protein